MSDPSEYPPPPPYPPPPDQPPAGYAPSTAAAAPAPAPPPDYGTPAIAYPTQPAPYRVSRNLVVVIAAITVVVVVLVGVIGYAFAGYALASSRISDASGAINAAQAHRSYVNTTFDLMDQQVTSLGTSDATMGKAASGQLVSESQNMSAAAGGDDRALITARSRLNDQRWLTRITSGGRLDAQATRIDHARTAIAVVKSAAGDYALLGQFLEGYYQALIDGSTFLTEVSNNNLVGATDTIGVFQNDVAKAQQLSDVPGLPTEFHTLLTALAAYAADWGNLLNSYLTGNQAAHDAALKLVNADEAALQAVDFSGTTAKIKAYYQHYRTDFNSEMDLATA